ncbi:hypothetical protein [Leifsonia aquatica]|uniref:hypothetical protein n=1 Tax=Leifsonia aquatica TaxID=144185 RepID=UPI003809273F
MAKGISISIASDTREFASGVKSGVIAPLEDADDAVKDIGRDASRLGELEDNMTAAQKATSKYERELEDAIDAQKKAARGARDIGDESEKGFGGASKNVEEFKDEARSNFSEVVSSFDGSMDSVADLAQGTLGGLAGSIAGPVGLAAGAGAAILGGMFTSMTTAASENAEKSAERVSDMVDDMLESGQRFASESLIQDKMKEIVKDSDQLKEVKRRADIAGVSMQTALRAEAGDSNSISAAIDAAQQSLDGLIASGSSASSYQVRETQKVIDSYKAMQGDILSAAGAVDLLTQASTRTSAAVGGASKNVEGLTMAINAMPKDVTLNVQATTAAADAKIAALRRQYQNSEISIYVTGKTRAGERVF